MVISGMSKNLCRNCPCWNIDQDTNFPTCELFDLPAKTRCKPCVLLIPRYSTPASTVMNSYLYIVVPSSPEDVTFLLFSGKIARPKVSRVWCRKCTTVWYDRVPPWPCPVCRQKSR